MSPQRNRRSPGKRRPTPVEIREEDGVRYLHFGSPWIQGAMRIARPWALELDYTRDMMAALLLRPDPDWPRNVLLIGLGTASLLKFLHRQRPAAHLTVVEIEPAVLHSARQFFKLPEDPQRIRIELAEASEWLALCRKRFDLILVDGFGADGRAGPLDTLPFYQSCRAHLTRSGLVVVNLLSNSFGYRANVRRLHKAFDKRVLLFPPCDHGNAIAFATGGDAVDLSLGEMSVLAAALRRASGLNLLPTLARILKAQTQPGSRIQI